MFGGTGYRYTQCTPHPFSPNINLASTGQAYLLVFVSYSLPPLFSLSLYSSVFLSPLPFLFLFLIFFIFLCHFLFLCFFRRCFGSRSPNQAISGARGKRRGERERREQTNPTHPNARQQPTTGRQGGNQPPERKATYNHGGGRGKKKKTGREGENQPYGEKPTMGKKKKTPRGGPLQSAQSGHKHHLLRNNWLFNNLIQNCICGNTAVFLQHGTVLLLHNWNVRTPSRSRARLNRGIRARLHQGWENSLVDVCNITHQVMKTHYVHCVSHPWNTCFQRKRRRLRWSSHGIDGRKRLSSPCLKHPPLLVCTSCT